MGTEMLTEVPRGSLTVDICSVLATLTRTLARSPYLVVALVTVLLASMNLFPNMAEWTTVSEEPSVSACDLSLLDVAGPPMTSAVKQEFVSCRKRILVIDAWKPKV